jgi:hypothetical protein
LTDEEVGEYVGFDGVKEFVFFVGVDNVFFMLYVS